MNEKELAEKYITQRGFRKAKGFVIITEELNPNDYDEIFYEGETLNLSKSPRVAYGTSPYELIKEFPIYFAIKGKIVGYFVIHDVEEGDVDNEGTGESRVWLLFHSETWKDIKHGETLKPSQGWRYYPKKDAQHSKGARK